MPILFKTKCIYCGKDCFSYAVSKTGELETQYCSKQCESNAKHEQRIVKLK